MTDTVGHKSHSTNATQKTSFYAQKQKVKTRRVFRPPSWQSFHLEGNTSDKSLSTVKSSSRMEGCGRSSRDSLDAKLSSVSLSLVGERAPQQLCI